LLQAMILKWIIFCYKMWSSLEINFHKSFLIFLGDISIKSFLLSLIFNYSVQNLSVTYLGLLLILGSLKSHNESHSLRGCRKVWQDGKENCSLWNIMMINTVLSAIFMYFLSFFPLSRWVEKEIDSLRRKFF